MHEVYPAMGGIWYDYLKSLSLRNCKDCGAELSICDVHISTSDTDFKNALNNLPFEGQVREYDSYTDYVFYGNSNRKIGEFYTLIRLIKQFHKGFVLPKRS